MACTREFSPLSQTLATHENASTPIASRCLGIHLTRSPCPIESVRLPCDFPVQNPVEKYLRDALKPLDPGE